MKFNRQEAQRSRQSGLSEHHLSLRSVGTPQSPTTYSPDPSPRHWLRDLGQGLRQWLVPSPEPTLTTINDPSGQTWWRAYNPCTHQFQWLDSEAEAMVWLDRQPY